MTDETKNPPADDAQEQATPRFGTFLGVFTPSALTILGLIMYLRFGWVLGNVGLGLTIVIVLLASSITFITGLSASAVATNMRVGAGGEYYMISHSLGLELGGAIGIPLYLCRTLSITFYAFGLAEAIVQLWPAAIQYIPNHTAQWIAAGTILLITAVAGKSASLALKLQIPIMIMVGASILALGFGFFTGEWRAPEWTPTYRTTESFWYVFAIFFPAVTGVTAGIGMSGDLKDPQRSIPRGTLAAVVTGTVIYLIIPVWLSLSGKISFEQLADLDTPVWPLIALGGAWAVYPGIFGAIVSSAFGSVLGGPRVLQALASDGLAPRLFARLSKTGQPTIATWASGAIALLAVMLGELNTVAEFVTILFLTLYAMINLSAALEQLVGDPSYRPTIHVPWWLSLLGALGCFGVMALISPLACVAALVLELVLYLWLRGRALEKEWGDVRAGFWMAMARWALLQLRLHSADARNWRPHILVFTGDPEKRLSLVRLAAWFNHNRGVVTTCQLVLGDLKLEKPELEQRRQMMVDALDTNGLIAFTEIDVVPDFVDGVISIAQANGIAGLQSNTLLFGWSGKEGRLIDKLRIMRAVGRVGKSTMIARLNWQGREHAKKRRIDLWWGGLENNGDMMLLFAYLLRLNEIWSEARIVVRSIVRDDDEEAGIRESLEKLIPQTRIIAETEIIRRPEGGRVAPMIQSHSRSADLVLLGLRDPGNGHEAEYAARLDELVEGLPTTIFVRNAGEFAGSLI